MITTIDRLNKKDEVTWFDARTTQPARQGQYLVVKQAYMNGMIQVMSFFEESGKDCIKAGFYTGHPQREESDKSVLFWAFIDEIKLPETTYVIGKCTTKKPNREP